MPEFEHKKVYALAKICHEANKALCESLGDDSQQSWSEAPEYNHESAMVGVKAVLDNPAILPEDLHDAWTRAKIADGWTYGPKKDRDAKTHPSIVPYSDLDPSEQYKDLLVIGICQSYTNFIGVYT